MTTWHTTPAEIAATLHAIADRIAQLPDETLPNTRVQVDLSMYRPSSTLANTLESVDLLAYALTGDTGGTRDVDGSAQIHYGTPHFAETPEGAQVTVVSVLDPNEAATREPALAGSGDRDR